MLKLLGSLGILIGCVGFGLDRIGEEKGRISHLQEVIRIIRRIQSEISYGKHTLPEICLILAGTCAAPYRECFRAVYDKAQRQEGNCLEQIWVQEFTQCMQNVQLQEEEKEILRNLPQNLGIQEEKYQAESIGQSMDLLTRKCREAEDAYADKSRMIFGLSILSGVFMTILFL